MPFRKTPLASVGGLVRIVFSLAALALGGLVVSTLSADSLAPIVLERHHTDQGESIALSDKHICTASKQRGDRVTLRCISRENYELLWEAKAHVWWFRTYLPFFTDGFTRDLHIHNGYLASAGTDGRVVLYEVDSGRVIWRHTLHDDAVWKVQVADGLVVSSGRDGRVIAAALDTGALVWEHRYHQTGQPRTQMVRSVTVSGDYVISTGFDRSIVIASLLDGALIEQIEFEHSIKSALLSEGFLIYGPWGARSEGDVVALTFPGLEFAWRHSLHHANEGYRGSHLGAEEITIGSGMVFSAGDDGRVVAVNLIDGHYIFHHDLHTGSVRSVSANDGLLGSIDRDGTVVLYDFSVYR